jgi:hypothetical protein
MKPVSKLSRVLAAAGLATLALSGVALGPTAARATPIHSTAASNSCAPGATCVTIPSPCPAGTTCPTVSVEPTSELGQNQWIYLNLTDFPVASTAEIYFCSNQNPITTTAPPYCVLEGSPTFTYPSQQLPISAQGTGELSFQTIDDPNVKGDTPLVGQIPGDSTAPSENFFCGDAADQCSVDVVDWALLTPPLPSNIAIPVPEDTAVIPLGFAAQSNGCQTATLVPTYSDNSIEWLIPHESPVVCAGKQPAVPVNTATSTSLILPYLQSNSVLFVDDPQATDVQAALAKAHYTDVPLAASAVVMGYVAAMEQSGLKYPFNAFKLTPNEVAGLTTYAYQGPYDGDMVKCAGGTCSAMESLNSVPGFVGAGQYGVYIPSADTGVTEELTDWVCNAPNVPFVLNGKLIKDPNTAQKTFTTSINQTPWPIKTCTTFDQFPPLKPLGTLFTQAADPLHAVKFLRAFAVPPQFELSPVAGFAPIDWGDARYDGLDTASLQNADGQFVAPTAASVQAEVAAEPLSKQGYPLPDPKLKVSGGYPMSTVIDALVPDGSLPSAQSRPIADMMNELLHYITTTSQLPDGYVPLPAKLETLAQKNLAKALAGENAPPPVATTTSASVTPSATTQGDSVTYSATVSASKGTPTGNVSFTTGVTTLCTATLAHGKATCSAAGAPLGTDTVTASYSGTAAFSSSSSTTVLTVSAPETVTTVPSGGGVTTTLPTRGTVPTTLPTTTVVTKTKGTAPGLSVADVTLSAAAAKEALPVALAVGGILIALSLGLSFVGVFRRRHAGDTGDAGDAGGVDSA